MRAVLLAMSLAGSFTADARPSHLGMVEGVVTGVPTGLALSDVSVTLRSTSEPWSVVRTTDAEGTFRFSGLPGGVYTIKAQQAGFIDASLDSVIVIPGVPVSEHLEMDVSAPQKTAPLPKS